MTGRSSVVNGSRIGRDSCEGPSPKTSPEARLATSAVRHRSHQATSQVEATNVARLVASDLGEEVWSGCAMECDS